MESVFLMAAAIVLCALNGYATLRIWRDRFLTLAPDRFHG